MLWAGTWWLVAMCVGKFVLCYGTTSRDLLLRNASLVVSATVWRDWIAFGHVTGQIKIWETKRCMAGLGQRKNQGNGKGRLGSRHLQCIGMLDGGVRHDYGVISHRAWRERSLQVTLRVAARERKQWCAHVVGGRKHGPHVGLLAHYKRQRSRQFPSSVGGVCCHCQ